MTLSEFITKLQDRGAIWGIDSLKLNSSYDALDVDPEAPIPVWNEQAEAWEV